MKSLSISTRVTLFVIVALVVGTSIVGGFAFFLERNEVLEANANRALSIAHTISAAVNTDEFTRLMKTLEQNEYYEEFGSFLNKTSDDCELLYLYIIGSSYSDEVTYFAEGYPMSRPQDEPQFFLGDTDDVEIYADEMYETIRLGTDMTTGVYNLGGYGEMISAFAPILDNSGHVLGVVGIDISVDEAFVASNRFALMMAAMIAGICLAAVFLVFLFVRNYISRPIDEIKTAADALARGDSEIAVKKTREDEIGWLAESFSHMIRSINEQSRLIEQLADGDLTAHVYPRSEKDTVNHSLAKMADSLHIIVTEIYSNVRQVTNASRQVADDSQTLAQNSSEQIAVVERLTNALTDISKTTKMCVETADQASLLADIIMRNAEKGSKRMNEMIAAVSDINSASQSIGKVIKVIDDIAFQTNILALNAAVEAARAGKHGKGFAVVAEEVRNLASKSAEAAKDTGVLITSSIEKANLGARIAGETAESLSEIVSGINKSGGLVREMTNLSGSQEAGIAMLREGLDYVAEGIHKNSESAQESAATSEEMSSQAHVLEGLVARFRLKEPGDYAQKDRM